MLGELTLDGRLRAVSGVLPMVLAARDRGSQVMVPELHVAEARWCPESRVLGARSLAQAVACSARRPCPTPRRSTRSSTGAS